MEIVDLVVTAGVGLMGAILGALTTSRVSHKDRKQARMEATHQAWAEVITYAYEVSANLRTYSERRQGESVANFSAVRLLGALYTAIGLSEGGTREALINLRDALYYLEAKKGPGAPVGGNEVLMKNHYVKLKDGYKLAVLEFRKAIDATTVGAPEKK